MKNIYSSFLYMGLIFTSLLFFLHVHAAGIVRIQPESIVTETRPGQLFEVRIMLETEEQSNAIQGILEFDPDLFEVREIRDGNSLISLWIERPQEREPGQVSFSGIIPGGFLGNGFLFSVMGVGKHADNATFAITHAQVALQDGKGTLVPVDTEQLLSVRIDENVQSEPGIIKDMEEDKDLPEDFDLRIASDPTLFGGKLFIVFFAHDKGVGIDHYEVREGQGAYIRAESPYVLEHQNIRQEISVKAVDNNGNERIKNLSAGYSIFLKYGILVLVSIVVSIFLYIAKKYLSFYVTKH